MKYKKRFDCNAKGLKARSWVAGMLISTGLLSALPSDVVAMPNIGVDANTLPEGILFARQRFFYVDYDGIYDEQTQEYQGLSDGDYYTSRWQLTEVAYGVTDNWTIVGNLWHYNADARINGVRAKDDGIGDAYFFSKNKLFSFDHHKSSGVALLAGARFPTGNFDEEPMLRIGDGSTDIGVGASITGVTGDFHHSLVAALWKNIDHKEGGNEEDEYEIRATTEWRIAPRKFNLQLEFKGLHFEEDDEYTYELAPGIQYTPIFPLTFQLSAKIPVKQKGYFDYDHQVVLGVSFGLPLKKPAK